ncbi:MAG: D-alanyl-D-alanine carboxypeptidase, partial [Clostridia bacterium]|nr:D-alanyl-D-alanine carboxypeptidase [Clostridia bacterium]
TTKIMSSIIALESGKLHSTTIVKADDIAIEGTSMGLQSGDVVSLLTLVKGMLLSSGNDAANVTATMVAGDNASFAKLMNDKARAIGMVSTNFVNPSGLTDSEHYSTAYDMALLGSYAIKNAVFLSICSKKTCEVSFGSRGSATIYNHNKLLQSFDGSVGIKTGFTKASGRCLVSAARRNGVTLVCVTLNAPDDWQDHSKLLDYAFGKIQLFKVDISLPHINVVGSDRVRISTALSREIIVPYVGVKPDLSTDFFVPQFLYAGIAKGDVVGSVRVSFGDFSSIVVPLIADEAAVINTKRNNEKPIEIIKEFLRKGLS